jgi:hypothetical protein
MRTVTLPVPMLGFVVATRAALAAGLGLLFADRLSWPRRRALGLALVGVGVTTTIPLARWVLRRNRRPRTGSRVEWDARLIGATRHPRKGDDDL